MSTRLGLVWVVAWVIATGVLGTGCGKSHRASSDAGTSDQSVMVDSEVTDGGGADAGRTCEGGSGALPIIDPPGSACRTSEDCSGGTQCFGASDPFCGICPFPMRNCEDDTECAAGFWCRESQPNCCGGRDSSCVPDCGATVACPEGEICDSATGRCERNGCLALDLPCPENQECDPARPDADALGCARGSCSVDSECDCGFCVTGTCEPQLGFCLAPPP